MDKISCFLKPKAVLLIIIIALSTSLSSCGRSSELDPKLIERSKQLPLLEYNILSSEKTHPHSYKRNEKYDATKVKYSHVRDCLIESERDSRQPDLRLIDWAQFNNSQDINVCLWRIFNSINNVEGITEWMEFHRLSVRERVSINTPLDSYKKQYYLIGSYLIERGKTRLSPYRQSVGLIKLRWAQKITIVWTEDKTKILRVYFQTTTL